MGRSRRLTLAGWISLMITTLPAAAEPSREARTTRCVINALAQACEVLQTPDTLELSLEDGRTIAARRLGRWRSSGKRATAVDSCNVKDHPAERHGLWAAGAQRRAGDHAHLAAAADRDAGVAALNLNPRFWSHLDTVPPFSFTSEPISGGQNGRRGLRHPSHGREAPGIRLEPFSLEGAAGSVPELKEA